ncbi:MAG: site-specific DNA-methyltransferase [Planctomycetota bacterium]|nr:MAG: site-specific DNA-methyltransferase [Planctomycetota bacterium]
MTAPTLTAVTARPDGPGVAWARPAPGVRLACADWLDAARSLAPGSVDLVYADPPFNTGRARSGAAGAFADRWPSTRAWRGWLGERLAATVPLLTPAGSILLHLEPRVSHHARLILDDLLGEDAHVNTIVWSYGLGGSSPRQFARKHDDILFYARTPGGHYFDPPMVPATSRRLAGRLKKATDVLAIPAINNMAHERVGWPTQKPLALLDVLVRACCPLGGMMLDPCCGSGTALIAAQRAGRAAIGADASARAVALASARVSGDYGKIPRRL